MVTQNRRRFVATLSSAGAAAILGATSSFPQERPLETTIIRIAKNSTICIAPQYVADDLLRAEGFTDIQYVERAPAILSAALGRKPSMVPGGFNRFAAFLLGRLMPRASAIKTMGRATRKIYGLRDET